MTTCTKLCCQFCFSVLYEIIPSDPKVAIPKRIEYLRHSLIKWADIFTTDKGVFIVHIHKKNVDKNCFEVSPLASIENRNLSRVLKKQYIPVAKINDTAIFLSNSLHYCCLVSYLHQRFMSCYSVHSKSFSHKRREYVEEIINVSHVLLCGLEKLLL